MSKARYEIYIRNDKGLGPTEAWEGNQTQAFYLATTYNLVDKHLYFVDMEKRTHNVLLTSTDHVHIVDVLRKQEAQ